MDYKCDFESMIFKGAADFTGVNIMPTPYVEADLESSAYNVYFNIRFNEDDNVKIKAVLPIIDKEVSRSVGLLESIKDGDPVTVEGLEISTTDRSVVPKRIVHFEDEIYTSEFYNCNDCF